jgi:ABC-type lipoprotein release transport system permease subunit
VTIVGCGTLAGLPLAIASIRPVADLLPAGVNPWDPLLLSAVTMAIVATGFIASWIPAHRAASVDPVVALRED